MTDWTKTLPTSNLGVTEVKQQVSQTETPDSGLTHGELLNEFNAPLDSFIYPVTKITTLQSLQRDQFIKVMNFLNTFNYFNICEVLSTSLDSNEFITHGYKSLSKDSLRKLPLKSKLNLIIQLLKLALFFESKQIKNYKLDIEKIYFDYVSDLNLSIRFYDFSSCEYDKFNIIDALFESNYLYQSLIALDLPSAPTTDVALLSTIISVICSKKLTKNVLKNSTPTIILPVFYTLNQTKVIQSRLLLKNLAELIKHSKNSLV